MFGFLHFCMYDRNNKMPEKQNKITFFIFNKIYNKQLIYKSQIEINQSEKNKHLLHLAGTKMTKKTYIRYWYS